MESGRLKHRRHGTVILKCSLRKIILRWTELARFCIRGVRIKGYIIKSRRLFVVLVD